MNDFFIWFFCYFHKVFAVCPCRYVNIGTEIHRPWLVLSKVININNYLF